MSGFEEFGTEVDMELDWDSAIETDGQEFILLSEGDYDFTVTAFERDRYAGGEKVPACWRAKLRLEVATPQGNASINHNMFMLKRFEWQLSAFFRAIGQKKKGEPLKPKWDQLIGTKGRAKIGRREYDGKTYNQIVQFYDAPETTPTAAPKTFKAGSF